MGSKAARLARQGSRCLIVASGPSATERSVDRLRSHVDRCFAVNDGYRLCWSADWLYAADWQWWRHHLPALGGFRGDLYAAGESRNLLAAEPSVAGIERIKFVAFERGAGASRTPGQIKGGIIPFSGAQAINLAALQGFQTIVLLGFDMGQQTHFFGDHPIGVRRQESPWTDMIRGLSLFAADLADMGVRVINASPDSALLYWPRLLVDDVIEQL